MRSPWIMGLLVSAAGAAVFVGCSSSNSNPDAGPSCGAGTLCGSTCTSLATDNANCGACGTACASGQVCSKGSCATSCGGGTTLCGSTCNDTMVDPNNCGGCGTKCTAGQVCSSGHCAETCDPSLTLCGASCVNEQTDNTNCGGCGNVCMAGQACSGGACGLTCQVGLTLCTGPTFPDAGISDAAADGSSDGAVSDASIVDASVSDASVADAAISDAAISDGAIADGATLDAGTMPYPYCADLQSDNANCGGCGFACSVSQHCTGGACCTLGEEACGGKCSNPLTDPNNCGSCGTVCPSSAPTCFGGTCGSLYTITTSSQLTYQYMCNANSFYAFTSGAYGFQWTDTGSGSAASVTVQYNPGVDCSAGSENVSLNGTVVSSYATTGSNCACDDYNDLQSFNVASGSLNAYVVGGANKISFTMGTLTDQGLMKNTTLGAFAQVFVTYK